MSSATGWDPPEAWARRRGPREPSRRVGVVAAVVGLAFSLGTAALVIDRYVGSAGRANDGADAQPSVLALGPASTVALGLTSSPERTSTATTPATRAPFGSGDVPSSVPLPTSTVATLSPTTVPTTTAEASPPTTPAAELPSTTPAAALPSAAAVTTTPSTRVTTRPPATTAPPAPTGPAAISGVRVSSGKLGGLPVDLVGSFPADAKVACVFWQTTGVAVGTTVDLTWWVDGTPLVGVGRRFAWRGEDGVVVNWCAPTIDGRPGANPLPAGLHTVSLIVGGRTLPVASFRVG